MNSKILKSCFIYTLSLLLIFPATYAQNKEVKFPKESLKSRVQQIAKKSGKNIIFDGELLDKIEVPALAIPNGDMDQALRRSLVATGFIMKTMSDGSIVIRKEETPKKEKPTSTGRISGRVIDEKGESIPGAAVAISGTGRGTITDVNGKYTLQVPAGETTIEVSFISYQKKKITGVEIRPDKTTKLDITLSEATEQLNEVVVTAQVQRASTVGMLLQQKAAISMTDGISAEQMKNTADNNVAQVLKRVAGVTVQDNKFVVVRGMAERYNNVQLNGSSLPSTEPNRRNFSFDVIPSNLIDNVVVAKTFTPDMPAEFTGGTVMVNTVTVPTRKFFTLNIGTGSNSLSTGKDFYSNTRYKGDYFLGSDARDWFKTDWMERYKEVYVDENTSTEGMNRVAAELPNHWGLRTYTGQPTQAYAVSAGIPVALPGGSTLGVVAAITYRHDEKRENYEWAYRNGTATADDGMKTSFTTTTAAILNIGWKNAAHRVSWKNLYNNRFVHDNSSQTDYDETSGQTYVRKIVSSPRTNILWQTRLDGEHELFGKKLMVNWFLDYNQLERDQPDDRYNQGELTSTLPDGREVINWYSGSVSDGKGLAGGGIFASVLNETKKNIGGNIEMPFNLAGQKQKLKAGYWGTFRTSDYRQLSMALYKANTTAFLSIQDKFSPDAFAAGNYFLHINKQTVAGDVWGGDNYAGTQSVHAAYLMGDFAFFDKLHIIGGLRMEDSEMSVKTITRFLEPHKVTWVDTTMIYRETRWLPSVNLTYDMLSSFKVRASYSKTLARPDFRERSAFQYYDVWERTTLRGNGELKESFAHNYDVRLEWYPTAGDIVSVSVFYKDFINPVETVVLSASGNDQAIYVNMIDAQVKGLEFNLNKSFGFIAPLLANLSLTGNVTLLEGKVKFNGSEVDGINIAAGYRYRPPIGLSPLTWNAGLSWQDKVWGTALNYGYTDRRIRYAGTSQYTDEYEAPYHTLDAQLSCRLFKQRMEIKLNASDLLAQPFIIYRNGTKVKLDENGVQLPGLDGFELNGTWAYEADKDQVLRKTWKGISFSMSVSWKL